MIQRFLERVFFSFGKSVFTHRIYFFIGALVITSIALFFTSKLTLDPGFKSLLPEDHPVVNRLDRISEIYGGVGSVILVITSEKYDETTKFIEDLVPVLKDYKETRYVDYKKTATFFQDNLLMYLKASELETIYRRLYRKFEYERQKMNPLLNDLAELEDPGFTVKDIIEPYKKKYDPEGKQTTSEFFHKEEKIKGKMKHTFVVLIKPAEPALNMDYCRRILAELEAKINKVNPQKYHKSIQFEFTGRYRKKPDSFDMLGKDFKLSTAISAIGVLLILFFYFRRIIPIVLVFSALMVGITWTLGVTQVIFSQLNLVTSFLVAILFGLGIDFGIHLLLRYKEERDNGASIEAAVTTMFSQTGVASFTSAATTAFAFFILGFSGFRAFQEFGIIAGVGVLLTLLAMLIFLTPVLIFLDQKFSIRIAPGKSFLKIPAAVFKKPGIIIGVAATLLIIAVFGITRLGFDYKFGRLLEYDSLRSYKLTVEIEDMFRYSMTPSIALPDDPEHEQAIIDAVDEAIKKNKGNKDYRLERVLGLTSFVPEDQPAKLRTIRKIRALVRKNQKYKPLLKKGLPEKLQQIERVVDSVEEINIENLPLAVRKNFQGVGDSKDKHVVLVFPNADMDDGKQILELAHDLEEIKVNGKPIEVASDSLIFAEILKLIQHDGPIILVVAFLGVFLLILSNFKNLKHSLIVLIPITIGIFIGAGLLGVFEVPLDFINVLVFPIMVGIGIDSGVHIFHRYLENRDVVFSVRNTGEAVTLSTMTTMWAFAALIIAENLAITGLGLVAVIMMASIYLCSVIVLPAVVLLTIGKNKASSETQSLPQSDQKE